MAKIKFEENLKKLEGIVEELERGDLTLDESLTKYENGIKLYKQSLALLEGAEKKVQILMKNENGRFQAEDFLVKSTEASAEKEV
ncbi:MAG: exodeoxyribonuclease VII small subunit [Candidatus Brocadiales bacterium]